MGVPAAQGIGYGSAFTGCCRARSVLQGSAMRAPARGVGSSSPSTRPCSVRRRLRISREGPRVCRLPAGGSRIRTVGPAAEGAWRPLCCRFRSRGLVRPNIDLVFRFVCGSLLEGDGFELLVPRHESPGFSARSGRSLPDSPLEGDGFELLVPPHESCDLRSIPAPTGDEGPTVCTTRRWREMDSNL